MQLPVYILKGYKQRILEISRISWFFKVTSLLKEKNYGDFVSKTEGKSDIWINYDEANLYIWIRLLWNRSGKDHIYSQICLPEGEDQHMARRGSTD